MEVSRVRNLPSAFDPSTQDHVTCPPRRVSVTPPHHVQQDQAGEGSWARVAGGSDDDIPDLYTTPNSGGGGGRWGCSCVCLGWTPQMKRVILP
jgi:hypothetical protein